VVKEQEAPLDGLLRRRTPARCMAPNGDRLRSFLPQIMTEILQVVQARARRRYAARKLIRRIGTFVAYSCWESTGSVSVQSSDPKLQKRPSGSPWRALF